tara:strand:+ start:607 stop:1230 length:624 start_codon:yes stop_codon:yes gene_type:complete
MATTKIDICARALVMIGANPITSFADGTTESTVASNLYQDTVKNTLSSYRWRFASKQQQLSRLTDTPDHKWDSAYQLPADLVGLHGVFVNDMPIKFERYGDMVYNDAVSTDKVYADYTYYDEDATNPEQFFPPYFIFLLELSLASIFGYAVAQNNALSDSLELKAQRQLAIAKNLDAQQRTSSRLRVTRFTNTRNSTGTSNIEGTVE